MIFIYLNHDRGQTNYEIYFTYFTLIVEYYISTNNNCNKLSKVKQSKLGQILPVDIIA